MTLAYAISPESHNRESKEVLHKCWLCGYVARAPEGKDMYGRETLPEGWIYLPGGLKSCSVMMFPEHPLPSEAGPTRPLVLTGYLFFRLKLEEYIGIKHEYPDDGTDPHQGD